MANLGDNFYKRNNGQKSQKSSNKSGNPLDNGFKFSNNYKKSTSNEKTKEGMIKNKIQQIKQKQKKENAKKAITKAASAAGPVAGAAAKVAVNTPKGEKYLDAYAQGSTEAEGIRNVKRMIKQDTNKLKIIGMISIIAIPVLFLVIVIAAIDKNADSQIYSNENGGTVQSDRYIDDKEVNIFAKYPDLYENIEKKVKEVSNKYKIEIDKYLIIATLIAPISNDLIRPIENENLCGEPECYYFNDKPQTWNEFLKTWSDQAELLAKMQILTYTNGSDGTNVRCGSEKTMEQYAKNDEETNEFPWYGWLYPVNWFRGFKSSVDAEVNAVCIDAPNGETEVPTVRTLSIEQGTFYSTNDEEGITYVKDPNTGGVYFWNLINENGFIHKYLKDYLSDGNKNSIKENYELNKKTIVDMVNYIYAYYDTIRKDCNGYPVIEGELDKINFQEKPGDPVYTLDFEDIFVGGSLLATYGGATGEVAKAQAIITRSEAYYNVVEHKADKIVGSVTMGCWWWKYNPTYDPNYEDQADNPNYDPDYPKEHFPEIYKAVTETRGVVVTEYNKTKVLETEYDAFCPTTREAKNGFYYLPDGQRNLPIDTSRFSVSKSRVECPCFQSNSDQPGTQFSDTLANLLDRQVGTPAQTTTETCWTATGQTKTDDDGTVLSGYKYHATGGHGRGVSQHGMAYFSRFGYNYEALIKLFLERGNKGNITKGISFKRYEGSILERECPNYDIFNQNNNGSSSYSGESNYSDVIDGTAFNEPLADILGKNGHTIDELNQCIADRVTGAGYGTREGVVEAGMGLLQCTMDMTGGYTYPYDHYGGIATRNPDLNGKLGVNSQWGTGGGTGCQGAACKLGLNCATFVRWSMCNGGMNTCSASVNTAQGMFSFEYFPGGTMVRLSPGFNVIGNESVSSASEAIDKIQPGDVLFSNLVSGKAGHVMLVVGKSGDNITIAENGRGTRTLSKDGLLNNKSMTYSVLLLDGYYADSSNMNSLSW